MRTIPMFYLLFTHFILSSISLGITMAGRDIPTRPSSVPSSMMPPLDSHGEDYVKMKPLFNHNRPFFVDPVVKGCLPKGYRHSSAPSRFVNNLPLLSCSKLREKP
ncbi:transmembrane [Salix suchowensis]|nr:transmembrane [Salix suchowensis]